MGIVERKEREKEQRRNDIIDAAERVFFSKGIENSTMDEVAGEAELSKGTLYLYFKSKEDLQFAISIRGADILAEIFARCVDHGRTGRENLYQLAQSFVEFAGKYRNYFRLFLFFQTSNLEELKIDSGQLEKYMRERSPLAGVHEFVDKGMKDGSLRDDIPLEILAATFWSQMMGLLVVLEQKKDVFDMFRVSEEDVIRTHLELVTNGAIPKNQ